ncbi:hypothetical protein GOHSU_04_01130 [Gordonia hirsuta DSM 44140 = NBRC 16056]|uniref:Uncharacterized protein n=1 Tax=Gordonia hirsuta DSM 44140 = NBRC 16056 TaxID=1121927 RepID=L7L5M5_9ACTN|nr:hypothetical protein [Gordonia hirsuta]GAC56244.1 hypothetical protein GOHSU_04_01130 [Gordonia hirsuta DSM 44140 = NBRC 16056]
MARLSRTARSLTALALAAGLTGGGLAAGQAHADQGNYVKTLRCDSPDPFPGPPLRITVDVWNKMKHPSDGLPAPAIALIASNNRKQGIFPNAGIYTMETTVNWRNVTTGKRGVVRVPTRASHVTWQAVIHPGHGRVDFTVRQKIGVLALVPMVNPQYSSCRGSAVA